jgi:hypothetical protein
MKKLTSISGAAILSSKQQKEVLGGKGGGGIDVEVQICGCDCAGNVTGPSYCSFIMGCPQVYTC